MKSIRLFLFLLLAMAALPPLAAVQAEPLHIYLTYSGAPETSVDINIVLPRGAESVDVYYDTEARTEPAAFAHHVKATYVQTPMELSDRRSMYVAALKDLAPGTVYHFMTNDEESGPSAVRKFRTLPGGTAPLRIINGGDMGAGESVRPLLALAGKENPDFAIIGGDLFYENGLLAARDIIDMWMKDWNELVVTTDGRMVPIVTAIGNHETNRYNTEDIGLRAPWYMSLFGRQAADIYYTRKFGDNLVVYFLDSGHLRPHAGAQTEWLAAEMAAHQNVKYKMAAYHVPLYPSHRPYDGEASALGRVHWGPLFDQFGLTVGLEHHDHTLKRSKPIRNGQVAEQGTVYIGDGCFGRAPREIDPQPRWYNHIEASVPHFWVIDVAETGLKFRAVDAQGAARDEFTLP